MKAPLLLAASLTLAFATTAFAQDAAPAAPASPADASAPASDAPAMKHHAKKHKAMHHHGHVAGDPAVIDHSGDHMVVTPTESKITVPAGGHSPTRLPPSISFHSNSKSSLGPIAARPCPRR
jgi:aconitase B